MTTSPDSSLKTLGNSDLKLTPIGFGAWAIGGGNWEFAWGPQDDKESIGAIHRALDLGINWIDTAAIYGLGHSEEIVARALKSHLAQAAGLYQVLDALERRPHDLSLAARPSSLAEELEARCGGWALRPSISTRSIGPTRRRNSKRAGRRWRGSASRARFAGSAFPTFQCRADEAGAEDCADHQPAAALLHAAARRSRQEILPFARPTALASSTTRPWFPGC